MREIRVGVLRGGPSVEYEVSLNTGGAVLKHLPKMYKGNDILLSRDEEWFLNGFLKKPVDVFNSVDVVFNGLHGSFGEDGKVQGFFESFGIPYTGSGVLASSLAMKKHLARDAFLRGGLKMPRAMIFRGEEFFGVETMECVKKVFSSMPPPWVVKPASAGSSVGVSICNSFDELIAGIDKANETDHVIIVEEYIKGIEATCGVMENFRGEQLYAFPVVEILPPEGNFFDYNVKYNGSTRELCPASFDNSVKREVENMARRAHRLLGCDHYSRSDFIISPRGIYILELNTLPGLTSESLLPKAAAVVGVSFSDLIDHLIWLALNRR